MLAPPNFSQLKICDGETSSSKTFRNWSINDDKGGDDERYDLISSGIKDGDKGASDIRMLLGTGSFNMLPGDVARIAFTVSFAKPAKGGEADGTYEDLTGFKKSTRKDDSPSPLGVVSTSLIGRIETVKEKYYQTIASGVNDGKIQPSGISINSISPNPANQLSVINYQLSVPGNIRLSLYNELGNEIIRLKDGFQDAGEFNYQLSINNYQLNSGVYYIRLQQGNESKTEKIVVVK